MHKISIKDAGRKIEADGEQTILKAALASGIDYPHGCGQGRCGACKSLILSGTAEMTRPYSKFALTDEERQRGMVLACKAVPTSDLELVWRTTVGGETLAKVGTRVFEVSKVTHDITRLRLKLEDGSFDFKPGQYALLKFGSCETRSYSMASLPTDEYLEFHIRVVPRGCASTYAASSVNVGDRIELSGPFGRAYLREEPRKRILAIAGGSGLAPMQSIVRRVFELDICGDVRLYHGVREIRDLYHMEMMRVMESERIGFVYTPVLSTPAVGSRLRDGLVGDAVVKDQAADEDTSVYIAGPRGMVEAVTNQLHSLGVSKEEIHADPF